MRKSELSMFSLILAVMIGFLFPMGSACEGKDIKTDLNNAVQHISGVVVENFGQRVGTLAGEYLKVRVRLERDRGNFLINRKDSNNSINGASGSNILGGVGNQIEGSWSSSIVAGSTNTNKSDYSTIGGGAGNQIFPGRSGNVVVGGEGNKIMEGNSATIVGGRGNTIKGSNSVVAGTDNVVEGNNSVSLGSGSNVKADNSFLWSDGGEETKLESNDVFAVVSKNGMVVNTTAAHSLAQLTVGGSLVVGSNDEKNMDIQCGAGEGKGVMKLVDKNETQKCLCSCNGQEWDSLMGDGQCKSVCNDRANIAARCGTGLDIFTGDDGKKHYLGTCISGEVVNGSYYMSTENVWWSCQEVNGNVALCNYHLGCTGEVVSPKQKNNNITPDQEYPYEFSRNKGDVCTFSCIDEYAWKDSQCKSICNKTSAEGIGTCYFGNIRHYTTNYTNSYTYGCDWNDGYGMFTYKCSMNCPAGKVWAGNSGTLTGCQEKSKACPSVNSPSNKFICNMGTVAYRSTNDYDYTWKCRDGVGGIIYSCSVDKEVRERDVYYNVDEGDSTVIEFEMTGSIEKDVKIRLDGGSYTFTIAAGSKKSESREYSIDSSGFDPNFTNGTKEILIPMPDFVYKLVIKNGTINLNYCAAGCKNAGACKYDATSSAYSSRINGDDAVFSWKCGSQQCSASCPIKNGKCSSVPSNGGVSCNANNDPGCSPIAGSSINLSDFYMTDGGEVTSDGNGIRSHCTYAGGRISCVDSSNMGSWAGWTCNSDYTMDEDGCSCNRGSACITSTNPGSCDYGDRILPDANYTNAYTYKCGDESCPTNCPTGQVWLGEDYGCVDPGPLVLCQDDGESSPCSLGFLCQDGETDTCRLGSTLGNTWDEGNTHYWKCSKGEVTKTCSTTPPQPTDCDSFTKTIGGLTYVISSMSNGETKTFYQRDNAQYCTVVATCSNTEVTLGTPNCVEPCVGGTGDTASCKAGWSVQNKDSSTYKKSYGYECYSGALDLTFKCNGNSGYGPKRNCNSGKYWNGSQCTTSIPALCGTTHNNCKNSGTYVSNSAHQNGYIYTWNCYIGDAPQQNCTEDTTPPSNGNCGATTTGGYSVPALENGATTGVVKYTQADGRCTRTAKCTSSVVSFTNSDSCDPACNTTTNPGVCKSWVSGGAGGYDGTLYSTSYTYKCYGDLTWSCSVSCPTGTIWDGSSCITNSCTSRCKSTHNNCCNANSSSPSNDNAGYYRTCTNGLGSESCHECKTNYHWDSSANKCVGDTKDCGAGTLPSSNVGSKGSATYTWAGTEKLWTYKESGTLGACEYKCASGYTGQNCYPESNPCAGTFTPGDNTIKGENSTTAGKQRTYKNSSNLGNCEYACEGGYHIFKEFNTSTTGYCVQNECAGTFPSYAHLNDSSAIPSNTSTYYFYSETSTSPCAYSCDTDYTYIEGKGCRKVDHWEWRFYTSQYSPTESNRVYSFTSPTYTSTTEQSNGCLGTQTTPPKGTMRAIIYGVYFDMYNGVFHSDHKETNDWGECVNRNLEEVNMSTINAIKNKYSYSVHNDGNYGVYATLDFSQFENGFYGVKGGAPTKNASIRYYTNAFAKEAVEVDFGTTNLNMEWYSPEAYKDSKDSYGDRTNLPRFKVGIIYFRVGVDYNCIYSQTNPTHDRRRHADLYSSIPGSDVGVYAVPTPIYNYSCAATNMDGFQVPALNDGQTSNNITYGNCTATFKCSDGALTRTSYSCAGWGGGGGGCFLAGTHVLTENGYKNIEDVEVGDMVLSYNTITEQNEYNKVIKKFVHEDIDDELYELVIDGNLLKTTSAHRFYVVRGANDDGYQCGISYEWVAAAKLKEGDVLMMSDGTHVTIDSIGHYQYHGVLYNLGIENVNNYYVDEGYLVHNSMVAIREIEIKAQI